MGTSKTKKALKNKQRQRSKSLKRQTVKPSSKKSIKSEVVVKKKLAHSVSQDQPELQTQLVSVNKPVRSSRTRFKLSPLFLVLLAFLGIQLMIASGWYWLYQKTVLSFKTSPSVSYQAHLRASIPTHLKIDALAVSLPIMPATIKDGVWETSDTSITHLATSARPLEGGNIVMYGHNRKHLLGNLKKLSVGDVIKIQNSDGREFEYVVQERMIVSPEHIEAVLPTEFEVLTLYTCIGFFDSQRLVLKAYPSKVSSM